MHLKLIYRNERDSLILKKQGFDFSTIFKKEQFKKKIKSVSIGYSD